MAFVGGTTGVPQVPPPLSSLIYDGTIRVSGPNLVNGHGRVIQLRGADAEGTISASLRNQGGDIFGGTVNFNQTGGPLGPQLNAWKFNVIRLGINEATWNAYTTYYPGTSYPTPDPFNIRTALTNAIAAFNAAGYYVILVNAWGAPGRVSCGGQMPMANQDNSITFWKSIASYYGFPNGTQLKRNGGTVADRSVMFELSNEPQVFTGLGSGAQLMFNGGFYGQSYYAFDKNGSGTLIYPYTVNAPTGTFTQGETVTSGAATGTLLSAYQCVESSAQSNGQWTLHIYGGTGFNALASGSTITGGTSGATAVTSNTVGWYIAGYAQIISALRSAGCGTVCLLGSPNYNKDMSNWQTYAPTDSTPPTGWSYEPWTGQIAATWHPYPHWGYVSAAAVVSGGSGYVGITSTTSSAGTTTTLNDTSQAWTVNQWVGSFVAYTISGTTYTGQVTGNTATTLTFNAVSVASTSGLAYSVGDVINLPMDESGGPNSNSVYWQAQLLVTNAVGGVIQPGGVALNPCTYAQPGGPTVGGNGNFPPPNNKGGAYLYNLIPSNPVGQAGPGTGGSTSGVGTGATFNLTFTEVDGGVGGARLANWPTVVTLKNTFNGNVGVPVILTETGEHYGAVGTIYGSPWMALMTSWCDTNGISMVAFRYNTGSGLYQTNGGDLTLATAAANNVIPNYSGGYGQFMWNWFTTHAP